jgi:hypothetical protein
MKRRDFITHPAPSCAPHATVVIDLPGSVQAMLTVAVFISAQHPQGLP